MSATIYDPRLFWVRRTARMKHAGPATTRQLERMAVRSVESGHSVAKALSDMTKYMRDLKREAPKGAA
jgi:hypothetical protein